MKSRALLTFALSTLPIVGLSTAAFAEETPTPNPTMSTQQEAPEAPENTGQRVEQGEKPHLGDDNPGRNRNGDEDFQGRGIFHDEEALFALGGAFVLGAGLAFVIMRRKKHEEI